MQNWINSDCTKGLASVIISTYNRAGFLNEALQSVADQLYRPIECIVVDDGSTDHTKKVMQEWLEKKHTGLTLRYIFQTNAGAQAARNAGTLASTGEYIQYLDSDDLLYKNKISEQIQFLETNSECDGVFGDWESGTPENHGKITAYKSKDFIAQMLTGTCIANFAILLRRRIVKKTGSWDVKIKRYQEVDFHLSALLAGAYFEYDSINCGLWRYHLSERIHNKTGLGEITAFYQKWEKKLKENGLFTTQIAEDISKWYMYLFSQHKQEANSVKIVLLKEVIRLNPSIPFYCNSKLQFLIKIVGINKALLIWIKRAQKRSKTNMLKQSTNT